MPKIAEFELPDGRIAEFEVPDNMSPEEATQQAIAMFAQQPKQLTGMEKAQVSIPGRIAQGMADPMIGAGQLVGKGIDAILPENIGFPYKGTTPGKEISKFWGQYEKDYQDNRKSAGQDGWDIARFSGNIISPVSVATGGSGPLALKAGMGLGQMALKGAGLGALGGLTSFADEGDGSNYWAKKAVQTGLGAAMGSILTPVVSKAVGLLGKAGGKLYDSIAGKKDLSPEAAAEVSLRIDTALQSAADELGLPPEELAKPDIMNKLRAQVLEATKATGEIPDPAALYRQNQAKALGIELTKGQASRDPMQYALERNLRGVQGAGEPLMQRFQQTQNKIQQIIGKYSKGASDPYEAGTQLISKLKQYDDELSKQVSAAYKEADKAAGSELVVPLEGLAQDYAAVIKGYGKNKVPDSIKSFFSGFGLDGAKKVKDMTVREAEQGLQILNNAMGENKPTDSAIRALKNAIKRSVLEADDAGGVYGKARQLAAERFRLHDEIPALEAASSGEAIADDFVSNYIIGPKAKTDNVKALADLLGKMGSREDQATAASQIGRFLQKAAFGENPAGDKQFLPESFAKALNKEGRAKLSAFLTPEQIDELSALRDVGSYIYAEPANAAVNRSNTASALKNISEDVFSKEIPYVKELSKLLKAREVKKAVTDAVSGKPDTTPLETMNKKQQQERLAQIISQMMFGTSGAAAEGLVR